MAEEPNLDEILNMLYINSNNWSAKAVLESTPVPQHKHYNVLKTRVYKITLSKSGKTDIFYVALFDKKDSIQPTKRMYNYLPSPQEL